MGLALGCCLLTICQICDFLVSLVRGKVCKNDGMKEQRGGTAALERRGLDAAHEGLLHYYANNSQTNTPVKPTTTRYLFID